MAGGGRQRSRDMRRDLLGRRADDRWEQPDEDDEEEGDE